MSLQTRMRTIVTEQGMKQKEFAASVKVTESYISNLLSGKRTGVSGPLAFLIEELYGYSAQWVQTGQGDKYTDFCKEKNLSPAQRKVISDIERMTDDEVKATLAFMKTLKSVKTTYLDKNPG